MLTVENQYIIEAGDEFEITGSGSVVSGSSLDGAHGQYFTANGQNPWADLDRAVLPILGDLTTGAAFTANPKFFLTRVEIKHRLTNWTNIPVQGRAYLVKARHDIGSSALFFTGTPPLFNIRTIIGSGFATQGIDPTRPFETNRGLYDTKLSLYNSANFCQFFKIVKMVNVNIPVSGYVDFLLTRKKTIGVRPARWVLQDSTQSLATGILNVAHIRGARFWIFQLWAGVTTALDVPQGPNLDKRVILSRAHVGMHSMYKYSYKAVLDNTPLITKGVVNNVMVDAASKTILPTGAVAAHATI